MSDEDEIRRLVSDWAAATKAGDVDTVLSLISDDALLFTAGQPPMNKADFHAAAKAHSGDNAPKFDGSSEIEEITVVGDWAFLLTKMRVVVTPAHGRRFTREGHTLSILKKENGKWVLTRDANMLAPVPNIAPNEA